ncbi:MAG: UDP-N-acetylglucosamine 1-carboxyvinyltransferase [Oscillospiraceae bacterium]|nr:UDP-N-acetylglucosamine 1-carboxyvinyltransferase [Oscillospiraceae bacterium]
MGKLKIHGGHTLEGSLQVQGAKNSVLPILAAAILVRGESLLQNCPDLKDVDAALSILRYLGCTVTRTGSDVHIDSTTLTRHDVPDELMREMRSSVIFLGAILGRTGEATLSLPGGCELGPRPIDLHLEALRTLGATLEEVGGNIVCRANQLVGAPIYLTSPSVGATENAMLAAVLAHGETVITNAAREPEIVDLQNFLVAAGAEISGAGTPTITIQGGREMRPVAYRIMPDRIVAATYLSAVALTGGRLELRDIVPEHFETVIHALRIAGCEITLHGQDLTLTSTGRLEAISPPVMTRPYPGFPTDAQPCLVAASVKSKGTTVFIENIFQNRYRYVEELCRMGADIKLEGRVAVVTGVDRLVGTSVSATDLRGGAALVVAALGAEGETLISEVDHIDRGYDDIAATLRTLGADIVYIES